MQVFSLEQLQEDNDGQRPSESGPQPHLLSSEPVLPTFTAAKPTVYALFRLMTTLAQSPSLADMLHVSARMIAQVIDTGLCLILLTEPPHHDHYHTVACVPALLDNELERHPLTIASPLVERLRDAVQQGRLLQLSTQEQDALNPLNNV